MFVPAMLVYRENTTPIKIKDSSRYEALPRNVLFVALPLNGGRASEIAFPGRAWERSANAYKCTICIFMHEGLPREIFTPLNLLFVFNWGMSMKSGANFTGVAKEYLVQPCWFAVKIQPWESEKVQPIFSCTGPPARRGGYV